MIALLDDWLMLVTGPLCVMPAEPATTEPPVGSARATRGNASTAAIAVIVATDWVSDLSWIGRMAIDGATVDALRVVGRRIAGLITIRTTLYTDRYSAH